MEEWSRKLKLLHWMMIERADGVSPLICFDDDGGDGGDGGDDGGDGGDDDDGGPEGPEGGESAEGDIEGGGSTDDEGASSGEGEGGGEGEGDDAGATDGATSDGSADAEADYEFGSGGGLEYADYGGAPDALGGGVGPETPDVPDPNVPDPNVPDPNVPDKPDPPAPFTPDLPSKEKDSKEKEGDKPDKDITLEFMAKEKEQPTKEVVLPEIVVDQSPSPPGPGVAGTSGTGVGVSSSGVGTGSGFGAGNSEAATGKEAADTAFEGWDTGPAGGSAVGGGTIEGFGGGSLGGGLDTASGGFGSDGLGGDPGAATGGSTAGSGGVETAGLDSGAGSQGGGYDTGGAGSQGGGGSGGVQDLFDIPMRAPSAKDREQELEREFQQQLAPPTPLPPPPTFAPARQAGGGIMDAITSALVGSAQAAPVSGRVSQAPIAPGTLPSGAVANPFNNPPTDPNKEQSQVPPGIPGIDFVTPDREAREGKSKEDDLRDSPFGPQAALNTFGFNFTAPPGFNMPSISGVPTGAPPAGQQTAQGPPLGSMPITANPVTTQSITPPGIVATGKGNLQSRAGQGRTDPFGRDTQKPDIFDPNTFAPPVGMLMAGVRSGQPPGSFPTSAAPFGPNMPTQAQAPPRDPTIFDPTAIQSQVPSPLQGLQGARPDPFGTPGGRLSGPTGQQTPFDVGPPAPPAQVAQAPQLTREQLDIMTNPTPYGPMTARQGITPPAVASRAERERERPENRAPLVVTQAPPPSKVFDLPPPGKIEQGPFNPPTRDITAPPVVATPTPTPTPSAPRGDVNVAVQDAHGNTAVQAPGFAPDPQAGNPLAGGPPLGATIAPPNFTDFGGGTGPLTQPQRQMSYVSDAERARRREARAKSDTQAKRDAIAFAMMNRPY